MASLEQWIKDFPVITRTYMAAALLTTAACALDVISPFTLYFSWTMVWEKGQFWRLFTNFFFFGAKFSFDFLFHMFFLSDYNRCCIVQYCRSLEEGSFRGRTADFFYMILFGATLLTVVAPFAHLNFLGSSLTFMMVYIWARRNPFGQKLGGNKTKQWMYCCVWFSLSYPSYFGFFALHFLLGNDAMIDSLGIAIGHLYYFLEDVYPLMVPSRTRFLKTPKFIQLLFASGPNAIPAADHPLINFEHEAMIQQQLAQQQQQQQPQDGAAPPAAQPDQANEGFVLVD